jgi:hypothetical protein
LNRYPATLLRQPGVAGAVKTGENLQQEAHHLGHKGWLSRVQTQADLEEKAAQVWQKHRL